jgi:RNA polymerase-interacting CarD/CdnL/TRCF family regulator
MVFHEGDPVMHWTYGLGHITRLEERALSGASTMYYAVQVSGDLTVWVPADGNLSSRLRPPTPKLEFRNLLDLLAGPGDVLPDDRHERKTRLQDMLRDGRAESLCRVIRDLYTYRLVRPLNDHDNVILKQARKALLAEWVLVLAVSHAQAEDELQRLLKSGPAGD